MGIGKWFKENILKPVGDFFESSFKFVVGVYTFNFDLVKEGVQQLFKDIIAPILEPLFSLMGIKDKTVHLVEVVTVPLIEDTTNSKYILNTILTSVLNNRNLAEELKLSFLTGSVATARAYLNYGRSKYIYGLPTAQVNSLFVNRTVVRNIIEALEGADINIDIAVLSVPNNDIWCKDYLTKNLGYVSTTNTLLVSDIAWNYVDATLNPSGDLFDINLKRTIGTGETAVTEFYTLYNVVPVYTEEMYYSIEYHLQSAPDTPRYWIYRVLDGTYPSLDTNTKISDEDKLEMLPIAVLRKEFVSITSDKTSEDYKSTKRLIDILRMVEVDTLIAGIEDNPDIDKIQDAFLLFGSNIYSKDPAVKSYVFNFFWSLATLPDTSKEDFLALSEPDKSKSVFVFAATEQRYNTSISFNYADLQFIEGSIGPKNTITIDFDIKPNTPKGTEVTKIVDGEEVIEVSDGLVNSGIILKNQIEDNLYVYIEINGLLLASSINTDADNVQLKVLELIDPTDPELEEARKNYLIPISFSLLESLPFNESEQIVYKGVHLVLYAKESKHFEYYQTPEFFKFVSIVIKIVAIIIAIFSIGTASDVSAALWALANQILNLLILSLILREALSHGLSDAEKGLVLLAVMVLSFNAAGINSFEKIGANLADSLLLAVHSVSTFIQTDTEFDLKQLKKEEQLFSSLMTTRKEELDAAKADLTEFTIDSSTLLNNRTVPVLDVWSTPEQFYTRTLTTNVAPIIYNQTSTYVSARLDLNNITPTTFNSQVSTDLGIELT